MKVNYKPFGRAIALSGVASLALIASTASAQDADENEPDGVILEGISDADLREIIVTGTLVRGIAPAGASVLATTDEDIEASGAVSVSQLLEDIPQLGSFGGLNQPLAQSPEVAVNRPNLRALPGFNTAGGSTTLVLMDGHRVVGMGVTSTTPDPDIIPPGVIQRLEIVPDGGSAIYGSDAVAGVLNFVTIDSFDGLKVDANYGFADDYHQLNANVTGGFDWGTGSVFASYAYAETDEILGEDRDYIRQYPGADGRLDLQCEPGNIQALAGAYAPAGTTVGVNGGPVNECDTSDFATVYPESQRHSFYAGLSQDLSTKLSVDMRAFYTNRKTRIQNGPFRYNQLIVPEFFYPTAQALGIPAVSSPFNPWVFGGIGPSGPFFLPGSANGLDIVQQVGFQFGENDASRSNIELDTWGISSEFSYDLDSNFRVRLLGNYGQSRTGFVNTEINEPALANAILAGLFNPFDPSTSDATAVDIVTNFQDYARTRQRFTNFRGIIDGDLFDLGAGAAKIAVGLEYYKEEFNSNRGLSVPGQEFSGADAQSVGGIVIAPAVDPVATFDISRDVKSAFGELVVPLIDNDGGFGVRVSLAGRYDDYSDVGDTFNPRIGATIDVTDWFSVQGAWGESFNAPSLADSAQADLVSLFSLTGSAAQFFAPPAELTTANGGPYPVYDGGQILAIRGNSEGIIPQEAKTWTLGFDMEPPVVPGLSFGATYYNIEYENFIGLAPFQDPAQLYRSYGLLIDTDVTQAELDATIAQTDRFNGLPPLSADRVYAIFEARKRNFGGFKLDGIDFRANYRTDTNFGALFLGSNGTYELGRKQQNVNGAPFIDVVKANVSRLRIRTTAGAEVGPVLGQIVWNFKQGYDLDPVVGFDPQSKVSDFHTFDLFFKLDVPGEGIAEDLSFTMNVSNVFDTDPPEYRGGIPVGGQQGVPPYFLTIGRLVQFGVSKKF